MPKKSASITVGSTDLAKEGIRMSFPVKLYQMLEQADERGFSHIVSWNKEGNGFCVANVEVFVREIIPQYYSISKYKSFQRQLSLYGYGRVGAGRQKGLRYHKNFIRGCLNLVRQMRPTMIKGKADPAILEQNDAGPPPVFDEMDSIEVQPDISTVVAQAPAASIAPARLKKLPTMIESDSTASLVSQETTQSQESSLSSLKKFAMLPLPDPAPVSPAAAASSSFSSDAFQLHNEALGSFEGQQFYLMGSRPIAQQQQQQQEKHRLPVFPSLADSAPVKLDSLPPNLEHIGDQELQEKMRQAWEQGFQTALALPSMAIKNEEFFGLAPPPGYASDDPNQLVVL